MPLQFSSSKRNQFAIWQVAPPSRRQVGYDRTAWDEVQFTAELKGAARNGVGYEELSAGQPDPRWAGCQQFGS